MSVVVPLQTTWSSGGVITTESVGDGAAEAIGDGSSEEAVGSPGLTEGGPDEHPTIAHPRTATASQAPIRVGSMR